MLTEGWLPLDRAGQDMAVGGIVGGERAGAILHAEHDERFAAVVAHGAPALGSHAHDRPLPDREDGAVDLEFAAAREEYIELLVGLVGVQESCLRSGSERLERKFGSGCMQGLPAEDLAGDSDFGSEFEDVFAQAVETASVDCRAVAPGEELREIFHGFLSLLYAAKLGSVFGFVK